MIQTEKLTKNFEGFTALRDITCSIPKGCIYGMVGSNGAGKSTFLRLITGVYKADEGTVLIDDQSVYENPLTKERIAYVPDELYFLQGASMKRMAELYKNIYDNFDSERFDYLTKAFQLNPTVSLGTFSKGMKRQAAIILALSCRPEYMFFDETFDGLDPVMRNLVKSLICQDLLENKATAIITSHSLRELEDLCDQLALLHKGGLVLQSDIANLKTSQFKIQIAFEEDYTRELFGDLDIRYYRKSGSVTNMIIKGDHEETMKRLKNLNPLLVEMLPLTLEEVFTYEMEALGYKFDDVLEEYK